MNNIKKYSEFVINEASYPKEATLLAKKVGGKVEPHFDLDDVYFISNDKDLNIMWSKESGYEVSDDDGKDLYHGDDMRKAEKAIKVIESVQEISTQTAAKTIAIDEGTDIGSWNQGGLTVNKNVLITQFVGPKAVEEMGLGRKCIQINVGQDYVSLNPADIVELKTILKSYKVK